MAEPKPILPPERRAILLDDRDNIAAAATDLQSGDVAIVAGRRVTAAELIPLGHKFAILSIAEGQKVIKYGGSIGSATRDIQPGQHVHLHNLKSDYLPPFGVSH